MHKLLVTVFFCSFSVQADWVSAIRAYEGGSFAEAKTEFEKLIPLANENAAFNLGIMAYQGQGQQVSLAESLARFMLAAQLGHKQAVGLVDRLVDETSAEQQHQARQLVRKWQSQILIKKDAATYQLSQEAPLTPINTPMPRIPDLVARNNKFGYIVVRYLVDGSGIVQVADSVDSFPEKVYEYDTLHAVRQWQYEATGRPHLMTTQINFWVRGSMTNNQARRLLNTNGLWEYAQKGAVRHQEATGSLLNLIRIVSNSQLLISDEVVLPEGTPDFSEWFHKPRLSFPVSEFVGYVEVKTNEKGEIIHVLRDSYLHSPTADKLIGEKVRGAKSGTYSLSRPSKRDNAIAQNYVVTHEKLTAKYWWNEAAKNGDITAQRILGAQREDWQFYLLQQNDPVAAAWHGARLILDGEREEGQTLLEQSAAAGYPQARQLISVLQQ